MNSFFYSLELKLVHFFFAVCLSWRQDLFCGKNLHFLKLRVRLLSHGELGCQEFYCLPLASAQSADVTGLARRAGRREAVELAESCCSCTMTFTARLLGDDVVFTACFLPARQQTDLLIAAAVAVATSWYANRTAATSQSHRSALTTWHFNWIHLSLSLCFLR